MKRIFFLCALALAACGNDDRLTPEQAAAEQAAAEQAAAEQNAAIGAPADDVPPPPPPSSGPVPAGLAYKAVGTEPGWALTVRGAGMTYQGDYGTVTISEPTPAGFRPAPGSYVGKRIKLSITPGPCSDGMSDFSYRHTVRLTADGKTVEGCGGGTIAPATLAGTNWRVTALNGRAMPVGASYSMAFAGDTLTARFGCNTLSGRYQANGDHVSVGDLTQTEMACARPEMALEEQGGRILSSNMRVERIGGDTMRLVSEAGSIDLRRAM